MALRTTEARVESSQYPSISIGLNGTSTELDPLEVEAMVEAGVDISDLLPENPLAVATRPTVRAIRRRSARRYDRGEPWASKLKAKEVSGVGSQKSGPDTSNRVYVKFLTGPHGSTILVKKPLAGLADRRGVALNRELSNQGGDETELGYDLNELYYRYNAKVLRKAGPVEWPKN